MLETSKTPGATQLLNIYEFGEDDSGRWIVDLPGYGYAKLSKTQMRAMATMINDYVHERETLDRVVVLIDGVPIGGTTDPALTANTGVGLFARSSDSNRFLDYLVLPFSAAPVEAVQIAAAEGARRASAELGRQFIQGKVEAAVASIRALVDG